MTLEEARSIVIECDAMVKELHPDLWCMFVCTVGGHLQFSVNRPKAWGLFTFDIKANAEDWLDQFKAGAKEMREFCEAALFAKNLEPKAAE